MDFADYFAIINTKIGKGSFQKNRRDFGRLELMRPVVQPVCGSTLRAVAVGREGVEIHGMRKKAKRKNKNECDNVAPTVY